MHFVWLVVDHVRSCDGPGSSNGTAVSCFIVVVIALQIFQLSEFEVLYCNSIYFHFYWSVICCVVVVNAYVVCETKCLKC